MVIDVQLLLSFVNFIILLGICIFYFKKNYVVIDKESYDTIVNFVQENCNQEEEEPQELSGGSGFFKEYIDDEDNEDEE